MAGELRRRQPFRFPRYADKTLMDGFVHTAENFAGKTRLAVRILRLTCRAGARWATTIRDFLNYYYYMASQFAVSDRWFSPVASKSVANRIATISGGHDAGTCSRSGQRRSFPATRPAQYFPGARFSESLLETLLHRHRRSVPCGYGWRVQQREP